MFTMLEFGPNDGQSFRRRNGNHSRTWVILWRLAPDIDCPKKYSNLGIRIEDDVLVTIDELNVLSRDCPKTIADIEAIVGSMSG